jgi:hypothetical protein
MSKVIREYQKMQRNLLYLPNDQAMRKSAKPELLQPYPTSPRIEEMPSPKVEGVPGIGDPMERFRNPPPGRRLL